MVLPFAKSGVAKAEALTSALKTIAGIDRIKTILITNQGFSINLLF
jgi:hypothetical protein